MRNMYQNQFGGRGIGNHTDSLLGLPAGLDSKQTAKLLGFQERDIAVFISLKLLKPLGKPVPNSMKYFAACEISALADNPQWLNAATQAIYDYWKFRNKSKSEKTLPRSIPIAKQEIPLAG